MPGGALAHVAEGHDPWHWSLEPWVALPLAASLFLYAIGLARLWRRAGAGRGLRAGHAARFVAGWLLLAVALCSPIDSLGGALFSMHMVQHELLMVAAAPLLVLSRPLEAWTWALAPAWRRAVGALARRRGWVRAWRALTEPVAAWALHALALWAWHVPAFFDAATRHEGWHTLQHASFLGTALLFWWSLLGRPVRGQEALRLASLVTTMLHTGALGALLTFAPAPWYAYPAPMPLGLSPLEDQQLGGLVMWVPGAASYLAAGLAIVAAWLSPAPARLR